MPRRWRPLAAFVLGLLILLTAAAYGGTIPGIAAQESVSVQGIAVNGTAGGAVPTDLPIMLHAIDPAAGRVATQETTTDAAGRFAFAAVAAPPGGSFVLVMDYAGMRYNSLLELADLSAPVEFTVYETTRDIGVIRIERQTMVLAGIDETAREIAALELLNVVNTSDRTLLPELTNITNPNEINFLRFSLPQDAANLEVQSNLPGGDIITIGNGFALTAPVPPGRHQVNYSYTFPYAGAEVAFNQRLIQGAAVYQVLAPERLAGIGVSPLPPQPSLDIDGTGYLVWEQRDIAPRQGVALELSNLPQPGFITGLTQTVADAGLWQRTIPIMVGIALLAVLVYAGLRGARPTAVAATAAAGNAAVDAVPAAAQRPELVQSIALLDEQFEQGQVAAAEYQARRAELLTQLRLLRRPAAESPEQSP